jgi:hypothetical protein
MDKCTYCAGGPEPDNSLAEFEKYGTNRLAEGNLPLCAEMCERPRRRTTKQRYELAASHCPMPTVLPTERIAHLGTADCCIHPPSGTR